MSHMFKNTIIILLLGSTSFFYWLNHANGVVADNLIEVCFPAYYESEAQLVMHDPGL